MNALNDRKRGKRAGPPGTPGPKRVHDGVELAALYVELGTLQAVANRVGVTRERVRQIIARSKREGMTDVVPGTARHTAWLAVQAELAEKRAARKAAQDPIPRLYRLCEELGFVPNTYWLQQQHGESRYIEAALRRQGIYIPGFLDEVVAETGLPLYGGEKGKKIHDTIVRRDKARQLY